jgi:hypothetical protein
LKKLKDEITVAGGVSRGQDGKMTGNIGGSYESEHGKISGGYRPAGPARATNRPKPNELMKSENMAIMASE